MLFSSSKQFFLYFYPHFVTDTTKRLKIKYNADLLLLEYQHHDQSKRHEGRHLKTITDCQENYSRDIFLHLEAEKEITTCQKQY